MIDQGSTDGRSGELTRQATAARAPLTAAGPSSSTRATTADRSSYKPGGNGNPPRRIGIALANRFPLHAHA
jgi:hypothetical protein